MAGAPASSLYENQDYGQRIPAMDHEQLELFSKCMNGSSCSQG